MAEIPPASAGLRDRLLAGVTASAVIAHLLVLYLPGSATPVVGLPGLDKVVHLTVFAVPVGLLVLLRGKPGLVAAGFAGHALMSEVVQGLLIPGRQGDPWDLLFDLLGIGVAVAVLAVGRGARAASPRRFRSAERTGPL